MKYADYMDMAQIMKELGIETQADLELFKAREVEGGESLYQALKRYQRELEECLEYNDQLRRKEQKASN